MKTGSKRFILLALILVTLALVVWFTGGRKQQVTLSDGTVVEFKGVTLGTNHMFGSTPALLVHRLPERWAWKIVDLSRNKLAIEWWDVSEPVMAVWLHGRSPSETPRRSVSVMLAPAGHAPSLYCGSLVFDKSSRAEVSYEWFSFWPRRAQEIDLVVFEDDSPTNRREVGRFHFKNPARNIVPPWEPEFLPAVRRTEDLEVRLLNFTSGISDVGDFVHGEDGGWVRYRVGLPGAEPAVFIALDAKTVDHTNEHWVVERVALSDPTGNKIDGRIFYRTERTLTVASALWPDEPAWKLTLDLKLEAGHEPGDLLVFTNVPIPEAGGTNILNWTNSANGVAVELSSFKHRPGETNSNWSERGYSWVGLTHNPLPPDMVLDFVSAAADEGTTIQAVSDVHSEESYRVAFKDLPPSASKLNLTFAVQKLRRAEFFVAPNWLQGTNSFEYVEPASKR